MIDQDPYHGRAPETRTRPPRRGTVKLPRRSPPQRRPPQPNLPESSLSETRSSSSRLPVFLRKYLFLAWLVVCGHIWFASDDDNVLFDTTRVDHSFAEPARETRRAAGGRERRVRDGRGAIAKFAVEKELEQFADEIVVAEYEEELVNNYDREEQDREGGGGEREVDIEALQPISSEKCCIPSALKQSKNPDDVDCFGTCYTERACDDMVYPFNSVEEKKLFPSIQLTEEGRKKLRFECMSPKKLTPPVKWCQKPHRDTEKGTPARLVKGIPPAGCSKSASSGGSGAFQHVIIFPSVKLAFCGIPKVGITMWEQFLRFYIGAKDYPSWPHSKLDRTPFQFDQLDPDAQRRIWADEEWTWAAFVRNPAERLLSGYLDKVKSNEGRLKWSDGNLTFEAFIDSLSKPANLATVFDDTGRQLISHKCASGNSSLLGLTWCSDPRKFFFCASHILLAHLLMFS